MHQPGEVLIQHCFHAIPAVSQLHLSLLASTLNSLLLLCTLLLVARLVVKHLAIALVSYGADAEDHGPVGGLVLLQDCLQQWAVALALLTLIPV